MARLRAMVCSRSSSKSPSSVSNSWRSLFTRFRPRRASTSARNSGKKLAPAHHSSSSRSSSASRDWGCFWALRLGAVLRDGLFFESGALLLDVHRGEVGVVVVVVCGGLGLRFGRVFDDGRVGGCEAAAPELGEGEHLRAARRHDKRLGAFRADGAPARRRGGWWRWREGRW